MEVWVLDQVIVKAIEGVLFGPLLYTIPICTFVCDLEVWPWPVEIGHPVIGEQYKICIAHNVLS